MNEMTRSVPGPNQPPIHWVPGALFPAVKRPRREANHLVRRLRMSGAIQQFQLYTFMVCIQTVLPFFFTEFTYETVILAHIRTFEELSAEYY
jgi:hypothetical protein